MSGVGRRGWFDPVATIHVRQTEQMQCGEECIKYQSEYVVSNAFACKLLRYVWNLISDSVNLQFAASAQPHTLTPMLTETAK